MPIAVMQSANKENAVVQSQCENRISSMDSHGLCVSCLGLQHAQAAVDTPGSCEHCARYTVKLRGRLARLENPSGKDILISAGD